MMKKHLREKLAFTQILFGRTIEYYTRADQGRRWTGRLWIWWISIPPWQCLSSAQFPFAVIILPLNINNFHRTSKTRIFRSFCNFIYTFPWNVQAVWHWLGHSQYTWYHCLGLVEDNDRKSWNGSTPIFVATFSVHLDVNSSLSSPVNSEIRVC